MPRLILRPLCRSFKHSSRTGLISHCLSSSFPLARPHHHFRALTTATTTSAQPTETYARTFSPLPDVDPALLYTGPLTKTFRHLKLFSLSSLSLSLTLTPFLFVIPSGLPFSARTGLAVTALATSGISTALVAWCGRPYVTAIRRLPPVCLPPLPTTPINAPPPSHPAPSHNDYTPSGVELRTLTLMLSPLATRVYDPVFLTDTTRPFAKWELAECVQLPAEDAQEVQEGEEETVAETFSKDGDVLGRWIVRWGKNGEGKCRAEGDMVRHFNVHEEMLETPIR